MRRNDRAMSEKGDIIALINKCDALRLGFADEGEAYIVPLSFGFEEHDGEFIFYVHGAKDGRRHSLAQSNARVCVELDLCLGYVELSKGALTADYKSFIGYGEICTVTGDEAAHGLELICRHCGFDTMPCAQTVVDATCVEKIVVREYTAKQRFA